MSVLFQALHKAARDYRDQKIPVAIPLLPLTPKAHVGVRLAKTGFALTLLSLGIMVGAGWLAAHPGAPRTSRSLPFSVVPEPVEKEEITAAAPSVVAVPVAAEPVQPLPAAGIVTSSRATEDPQGITLPVDSQAVPPEVEPEKPANKEIVQEKEETRAQPQNVQKKKAVPLVMVSAPGAESVAGLVSQARAFLEKQRYADALALYNKALERDSNAQEAWAGKIHVLVQGGQPEALAELDKMMTQRPFSAAVHAAKAQIYSRNGQADEALKTWRRAVELEPANKDYRLSLAIQYDRMGKEAEALGVYRQLPLPLSPAVQQRMDYLATHGMQPDPLRE